MPPTSREKVAAIRSADEGEDTGLPKGVPVEGRREFLWLPTAGIAMATPFLAWFAVGDLSFREMADPADFHQFGPYDVGPASGYVVGLAALVAATAIAVLLVRAVQGVVDRRSWGVVAALAGAGALGAAGWRICTAGVVGTNIDADFVMMIFPVLIAALLVLAIWLAGSGGRHSQRRTRLLTLAAVLVVPAQSVGLFALGEYDASAGIITYRQYGDVRIGTTSPECASSKVESLSGRASP